MKQAIVVVYVEDQHCPSQPRRELLAVPDDTVERDAILRKMFVSTAYDGAEMEDITVTETPPDQGYGDITVTDGSGVYMYLTFTSHVLK
jgi:hypothetical protein